MWYVVQVRTGMEEKIRRQCRSAIDEKILEQCFVPHYKEKRKYQGTWHIEEKIMFPGYVFVVSERPTDLYENFRKVIGLTKLLGTGKEIVPLTEDEVELLKKLGIEKEPMDISMGIMENGIVIITEGPLEGMEGFIRRIDRHKRKVWLEVNMFGRTIEMEAGLEIIKKI